MHNVYSFTVNSPGSYTLVPGFPFGATMNSGDSDIAVSSGPGATAGEIYTNNSNGGIRRLRSGRNPGGTFNTGGEICGLATDNEGNLWAGNYGHDADRRVPGREARNRQVTSINTSSIGKVCKLTVDPVSKDVYAMPYNSGPIYQYTAASGYTEVKEIFGTGYFRMAVNGAKHVLYVTNDTETIYAISTITGTILEEITPGGGYRGVAVDESNDTLYAFAYGTQRVREIPLALVPKAITGEPTGNRTVSGTVAPDGAGNITECKFEWGSGPGNYDKPAVPCDQATPITSETAVTATLPTGEALSEQEYHYRVRAGTATPGGVNVGLDEKITPHNVLGLRTEAADLDHPQHRHAERFVRRKRRTDGIQIRMGRRQNR